MVSAVVSGPCFAEDLTTEATFVFTTGSEVVLTVLGIFAFDIEGVGGGAMTAASARRSREMRFVRATVPLPTGVACEATARARAISRSA